MSLTIFVNYGILNNVLYLVDFSFKSHFMLDGI